MRHFTTEKNGSPYRQFVAQADLAAGDNRTLVGYAMLWNVLSLPDGDGTRVKLLPGSAQFDTPTLALFHHNYAAPVASTDAGLSIHPDDKGVKVTIPLADTSVGRDLYELVRTNIIKGMSFGMYNWTSTLKTESGASVEAVSRFSVDEVTITAIPRFTQTTIAVKSDNSDASDFARKHFRDRSRLDRARLNLFA